mgnify:CR=1 FL=1
MYYYGEEAARAYYGAWAPPPGTPNPYGVNPNGISSAPAAAPQAASASSTQQTAAAAPSYAATYATQQQQTGEVDPLLAATSAPQAPAAPQVTAPQQEARETSRRHVSNLPAWMTKN